MNYREASKETLIPFSKYRPTEFDCHITVESIERWKLLPVQRNRDSGPLEQSNFAAMVDALGGESEYLEIHRFSHWANGWFEIAVIDTTTMPEEIARKAYDLIRAFEDHPIIDEEDYSERLSDDAWETFENCYRRDIEEKIVNKLEDLLHDWSIEEPHNSGYADLVSKYLDDFSLAVLDDEASQHLTDWLESNGLPDYYENSEGANFDRNMVEDISEGIAIDKIAEYDTTLVQFILAKLTHNDTESIGYCLRYLSRENWTNQHYRLWILLGYPTDAELEQGVKGNA